MKWSEALKLNAKRGNLAKFEESKIVPSLYRPFAKQWLFFDKILNERFVRLIGQVVRVSIETVRIVTGLPDYR